MDENYLMNITARESLDWEIELKGLLKELGKQEQKVAEYFLKRGARIAEDSIVLISRETGVSRATIVRVCQRLGYNGLRDFRMEVVRENAISQAEINKTVEGNKDPLPQILEDFSSDLIRSLTDTFNKLEWKELIGAANAIRDARYIYIYGVGGSVPIANFLKHNLMKIGITSYVDSNPLPRIIDARKYDSYDVAIGISYSGSTQLVIDCLKDAKQKGATTISMTSYGDSPLKKYADYRLYVVADTILEGDHSIGRISMDALDALLYIILAKNINNKR